MPLSATLNTYLNRIQNPSKPPTKVNNKLTVLKNNISKTTKIKREKVGYLKQQQVYKNQGRNHVTFFKDYRKMDSTYPIIKSALDIYGEEACTTNLAGNIITIESTNEKVTKELESLFFDILKINNQVGFKIIRNTCKFGNTYGYLVTTPEDGVVDIIYLPADEAFVASEMYIENSNQPHKYVYQGVDFEHWEIVHWKNSEDLELEPYGQSILRCILDTWRRVILMREALIIYRITRAPSRFLFKLDTTGMAPAEALDFAKEVQKEYSKKSLQNPQTGEIDFKYSPLSIEDNVYVPKQAGDETEVSTLEGASNLADIEDYKIIKSDLFAGLKIPKSHLTFEEELSNKGALADEDVRFANTIIRHQGSFVEGLVHIAIVHLYKKGFSESDIASFDIKMNNPSRATEKAKLELVTQRVELAQKLWSSDEEGLNFMSFVGVCTSVLKFSEDEVKDLIEQQVKEKRFITKLKQLSSVVQVEDQASTMPLEKPDFTKIRLESADLFAPGSSLINLIEKKAEEEINKLFKQSKTKASPKQIREICSKMQKNIEQTEKDLR